MDDRHCSQIMGDIWEQKKQKRLCDIVLRVNDGMVLAHKCVICANSPFFDSVLTSNSTDSIVPELDLSGWSLSFINSVVDYMYSGEVNVCPESIVDLLTFADHYGIAGLRQLCIDVAKGNVSSVNWLALLKLTRSKNLEALKGEVADFILNADEAFFFECQEFHLLSHDEIIYILSARDKKKAGSKKEALQHLKLALAWTSFSFSERQQYLETLLKGISVRKLDYARIEEVLYKMPDLVRTHEEVVVLIKAVESNQDEDFSQNDDTVDGDSDVTEPMSDHDEQRKGDKGKDAVNKNKRKASTPVRYDSEEAPLVPLPPSQFKVRGRPPGRPNSRKKQKVSSTTLVRRKLLTNASRKQALDADGMPKTRKPRKPRTAKKKKEGADKILECPRCLQICPNSIFFRQHMRQHGDDSPFECDICSFQTKHYGMFLSHKRRKHREGGAMIKCSKCPKMFTSESACSHHMRGHGTEVPLLCDICGFTTKHHATMNLHKRVHQGKVFKCQHEGCTYEAVRKNRFLDHLSGHEGMKNHICSVCGKSFSARKHLLRHENIHKGVKITCELCDYETPRNDKLRQHIKSKHPNVALEKGMCTEEEAMKQLTLLAVAASKPTTNRGPRQNSKKTAAQTTMTSQEETSHATQAILASDNLKVERGDMVREVGVPQHVESVQIQGGIPVTVGALNEEMLHYLSQHQTAWQYQTN